MKDFTVTGHVTISVSTHVRAKSKAEAKRLAAERGMQGLCYQCSTAHPDEEWVTGGELDGEPTILGAEEVKP